MSKSCDGHVIVKHGKLRSSRKVRRKVQSKVLSFQLRYVGRVSTSDKKIFIFLFSRNYYSFYSFLPSWKTFDSRVSESIELIRGFKLILIRLCSQPMRSVLRGYQLIRGRAQGINMSLIDHVYDF